MNNNVKTVINENGEEIRLEILFSFRVDELNKGYIVYSVNDDGVSDDVTVCISEFYIENDVPKIKSIDENEKEMVLLFYESVKSSIVK